jgi:hypothetical protein
VFGVCVTNSNGFCIWWLDLLALLYNYNKLRELTINDHLRLALFLTGLRESSPLRDWLDSDVLVGHFFSLRCPMLTLHGWTLKYWIAFWILLRLNLWLNSIHEWTLFYNFGRSEKRPSSRTVIYHYPVVKGMSLLIFVEAGTHASEPLPSKWTAVSVAILSCRQYLPSRCLANGHILHSN